MPSPHFSNDTARSLWVIAIVTTPICILATILRFVSTRRVGRRHGGEDWFAYTSLAVFLVYITMSLIGLSFLDGRSILTLSRDEILFLGKSTYAVSPLFVLNQLFAKLSILCFYYRIFGVNRTFAWYIYVLGAIHVAWSIATLCIYLFSCQPISKGWDLLEAGTCINYSASVAGAETVNSATDFALAILAWIMVLPLHIKTATKWKIAVIFSLGCLAGIIGFVKIGETYVAEPETLNWITALWGIIQMALSIICCCTPTYSPILPDDGFFSRLTSRVMQYGSRSRVGSSVRSKQSQSLHPEQSCDGAEWTGLHQVPSEHYNFLKLDNSSAKTDTWAESTRWQPSMRDPGPPSNMINVQRSVEIV